MDFHVFHFAIINIEAPHTIKKPNVQEVMIKRKNKGPVINAGHGAARYLE